MFIKGKIYKGARENCFVCFFKYIRYYDRGYMSVVYSFNVDFYLERREGNLKGCLVYILVFFIVVIFC